MQIELKPRLPKHPFAYLSPPSAMNDFQLCRAGYPPELVKAHRDFSTRFGNMIPISVYKEQFWDTSVAATSEGACTERASAKA